MIGSQVYNSPFDGGQRLLSASQNAELDRQNEAFHSLRHLLRLASDSPRLTAMLEELDTLGGRAAVDWEFINLYFQRSPAELARPWTEPKETPPMRIIEWKPGTSRLAKVASIIVLVIFLALMARIAMTPA
jgi:hypothetical protein